MKSKTTGPGLVYSNHQTTVYAPGGGVAWYDGWSGVSTSSQQTTASGGDTLEYFRKRSRGDLLPYNVYSYRSWHVDGSQSSFDLTGINWYGGYRWSNSGPYQTAYPRGPAQSKIDEALAHLDEDKLVQAAAAKMAADFDALTFLAEIGQLRTLVWKNLWRILSILRSKRWGKVHLEKGMVDLYLEIRYALRPLYYDILNIIEIANKLDGEARIVRKHASAAASVDVTEVVSWPGSIYSLEFTVLSRVSSSGRGRVAAKIIPPKYKIDPLTTAWELLPWSFVIDWFIGVGTALDALAFTLKTNGVAGFGTFVEIDTTVTMEGSGTYPNASGSMSGYYHYVEEIRTRKPSEVSLAPHVNLRFDWWKVADVIGFIYQAINDLHRSRR